MKDTIYENYTKDIVNALRQISSLLYHNSREMKQRYGITSPQLLVLKTLVSSQETLSAIGISRILSVSPSNITAMLDRLEKNGFIQRHRKENDRRTIEIIPTQLGKNLAQKTAHLIEEKLIRGLKDLTDIEISSIYLSLKKVIEIAGKEQLEAVPFDQFT